MKTTISLIFAGLAVLLSACTTDGIPTKPNNPQTNGEGIIAGKAYTLTFKEIDHRFVDNSGINVQAMGTNIITTTDSIGNWVLRGLDSGSYTLRFTKPEYDTLFAYYVQSNGIDSVYLSKLYTDSTYGKPTKNAATVRELPAVASVISAVAQAAQEIYTQKDPRDSTVIIHSDTVYRWSATFTIGIETPNQTVKESIPGSYMACITDSPTLQQSEIPNKFIPSAWQGHPQYYFGEEGRQDGKLPPERTYTVNISLEDYAQKKGWTLTKGMPLYLHIIPVCVGLVRDNDEQTGVPDAVFYEQILYPPQSFPIQWQ